MPKIRACYTGVGDAYKNSPPGETQSPENMPSARGSQEEIIGIFFFILCVTAEALLCLASDLGS